MWFARAHRGAHDQNGVALELLKAVKLENSMKADVLDLLFPAVRAEMLRALFHHTRREMYVREIARWQP